MTRNLIILPEEFGKKGMEFYAPGLQYAGEIKKRSFVSTVRSTVQSKTIFKAGEFENADFVF